MRIRTLVATFACVLVCLFGLPGEKIDPVLPAVAQNGPYGDCIITEVVVGEDGIVIAIFMVCF